ncbi:MraY family glycosyltransferase [Salinibacter grassmerensis]|uniref:MraY family glycosyltransferase n=1 Tax=Salinibacter grassmerensis TaxID=3040353 RepID=UPI0021E814A2|nr:MraY family glycosyltransferase [Salinibacter grassmerensis]
MATPLFFGLVGSVVAGFLVTVLLTGLVCEQAPRLGLLDRPTQARKVHTRTTPTGGGLAIAVGLAVGLGALWGFWGPFPGAVQSLSFWGGAAIMLATGYWDDRHALDAKGKFAFQLVAAYLLLHSGTILPLPGGGTGALATNAVSGTVAAGALPFSEALYIIPLSMLWIVGIINAVNLIDGLDGLATGIIGIAFLACAALFGVKGEIALMAVGVVMAGALIGFLPHNFKPATIFMGDSGSLLLGYLLAGYTLQGPLHTDPVMALLILPVLLGVPLLDTGTAIIRRFGSARTIFAPDRRHVHHRLVDRGTEQGAVLILYGVGAWFGSAAVLMGVLPTGWGFLLAGSTVTIAVVWAWRLGCLTPAPATDEMDTRQYSTRVLAENDIPASIDITATGDTVPARGDGAVPEATQDQSADEQKAEENPVAP